MLDADLELRMIRFIAEKPDCSRARLHRLADLLHDFEDRW